MVQYHGPLSRTRLSFDLYFPRELIIRSRQKREKVMRSTKVRGQGKKKGQVGKVK